MSLPGKTAERLANVIRRLSSDQRGRDHCRHEHHSAPAGILWRRHSRARRADRERRELSEKYQEEVRAQIKKAHEVGYEKGVRAAEARFRPDGKLEFSEVALFVERQINRLLRQARVHSQDGALRPSRTRTVSEAGQVSVRSFCSIPRREDHVMPQTQANIPTALEAALDYAR